MRVVQQSGTCTGIVKDGTGEAVIGASVMVKGTTNGTITGLDGDFTLNNVELESTIVISFIGYQTKEVQWTGTPLKITLQDDSQILSEVVVVGYGTQKKVNVTGAVSMVDSKVLESRPVQNVSQALQGQIPGLTMSVGNGGGSLDSSLGISIRGGGTIGSGSSGSPLVLIDGIEGNMNTVNPNDIATVSVLKDAASASIYGARAAFGVILITTKNGKQGKTRVNYTGNVRFSTAIQVPDMTNSIEFANYYNVASTNGGGSPVFSDEVMANMKKYINGEFTDPTKPEYYGTTINPSNNRYQNYTGSFANTDWFDEFYNSGVPSHEHNLSFSGGNEKITYMLSGNFLDQKGLLRHGEDRFNRYTLNGKISAELTDWLTMNFTTKWTRESYDRPTYMTGLFFHNIARRWPTCITVDPHGNWASDMEIIQMREGGKQNSRKDWNTNQLQFIFEPIKDWHITAEGSMRQYNRQQHWAVLPIYGYDADNQPYLLSWSGGAAGYSEVQDSSEGQDYFSTNIYSDYSKTIGGHYFKVMGGFNAELYKNRNLYGFGTDLITSTVPELNTTQDNQKAWNSASELAIAGFFGRLNYNYKERYILEANLRYDGSSRFVGDKRWGLFPSFSTGWNIAREEFFAPLAKTIGTLKLRGSWGQLGNNALDAYYPFFQSMSTGVNSSAWLINGSKQNTSSLPGIVSSLLTWETVESWDVGFDWGMLNNRFTGSFSYYNRLTKDMVANSPNLPGILGATPPKLNNADLKSYGWELELSWRDQIKDFKYGVRFVLDDNKEKITRYYNPTGALNTYYAGRMVGEIWGYTTVGIAQSQEEMDTHLANNKPNWGSAWTAGDVMYKDLDGDGKVNNGANTLDDHGDLRVIGNNKPRYKYGFTLDGSWKGLDVSIFLQGVMKRDYWLAGPYFWGASGGMWQSTAFKEHLDYWSPENTGAYYPRPYFSTTKNQETQTRYLQNAAYLRLKNLQIGYTLPKAWTRKANMESVRIYFSGDNLLTLSDINGVFDPETLGGDWGDGKLYPLQRTISFGLNVNF
nr:TonB-dependent receptor [Bacteroides sp. 519]